MKHCPPPHELLACLKGASRILAITHMNPDGDALGSLAAFGFIAGELGAEVNLYCETPLPDHFSWLNFPVPLREHLEDCFSAPDCIVLLDCADDRRAGDAVEQLLCSVAKLPEDVRPTTVCIDHHIGNPLFADHNWVDPAYCATGLMVGTLAQTLGIPLAGFLGEAVYLALVADTGSFSFSNTDGLALHMAAEIIDNGLSVGVFTDKYENTWQLNRMHLWGALMSQVRLECKGQIVVSVVTSDDLKKFDCTPVALEGYASWLRRLQGVRVVLLSRSSKGASKISLRSMGDVDVQSIAAKFGGGGHIAAAGVSLPQQPAEAAELVLHEVIEALGIEN